MDTYLTELAAAKQARHELRELFKANNANEDIKRRNAEHRAIYNRAYLATKREAKRQWKLACAPVLATNAKLPRARRTLCPKYPKSEPPPPMAFEPLIPLPPLPVEWQTVLDHETIAKAAMEARTGQQWADIVASISDDNLRVQVAMLVWWDFFGDRTQSDRWPHLDDYLTLPFVDSPKDELRQALWSVGYPAYDAAHRIKSARGK